MVACISYWSPFASSSAKHGHSAPANQLNRHFTSAPKDLFHSHSVKEGLWNVAKVVSVVAFATLSVVIFVGVSMTTPTQAIWACLGILLATSPVSSFYSWLDQKAQIHNICATRYEKIEKIHNDLKALSPSELHSAFQREGVDPSLIEHMHEMKNGLSDLSIGLAHLIFWKQRGQSLFEEAKAKQKNVHGSGDKDFKKKVRMQCHELCSTASAANIRAAYHRAILLRPYTQKTLHDIGSWKIRSAEDFYLKCAYNDLRPVSFFKFHNKAAPPITAEETLEPFSILNQAHAGGRDSVLAALSHRILRELT